MSDVTRVVLEFGDGTSAEFRPGDGVLVHAFRCPICEVLVSPPDHEQVMWATCANGHEVMACTYFVAVPDTSIRPRGDPRGEGDGSPTPTKGPGRLFFGWKAEKNAEAPDEA